MKTLESVQVLVSGFKKQIEVNYEPINEKALYDICDLNGRVILSGQISQEVTYINISDLIQKKYILLILDGNNAISRKFQILEN